MKNLTTGALTLVSSLDGTAAQEDNSGAALPVAMSSDDRYVLFQSSATNLVSGATGTQAYVKDLTTGAITLASSTDGTAAQEDNQGDVQPEIFSADGRYVVFASAATNFVSGTSGQQLYLKDLQGGAITLVSSTDGTAANEDDGGLSTAYGITSDDRYVLLYSHASNFVSGATGAQVYLKDLVAGTLTLVSSTDGTAANEDNSGSSVGSAITPDGHYAVFLSSATNFVTGASGEQVYRKDLHSGALALVSSTDGTGPNEDQGSANRASISADGRYVAYWSADGSFFPNLWEQEICLKDMQLGTLSSPASDGTVSATFDTSGWLEPMGASLDGTLASFQTPSNTIFPGATGALLYVKNIRTGELILASSADGTVAHADTSGSQQNVVFSPDDAYVSFSAITTTYLAGTSGTQTYLVNLATHAVALVSSTDGTASHEGNGSSQPAGITSDDQFVLLNSAATNFVSGTSGSQVFLKHIQSGAITLVSSTDGTAVNEDNSGSSAAAAITPNGQYVLFTSSATNFVGAIGGPEVFRKDLIAGTIALVSSPDGTVANADNSGNPTAVSITPDGRYVLFGSQATNLVTGASGMQAYLKDMQTGALTLVSSTDGTAANDDLSGTTWVMDVGNALINALSSDGRYAIFSSEAVNWFPGVTGRQVYMKDTVGGAITLLSSTDGTAANAIQSYAGTGSATVGISADGSRVIFWTSLAQNLVPETAPGQMWVKALP